MRLADDEALPVREGVLQRVLARQRRWQDAGRQRGRWLLLAAAALFVGATAFSIAALPPLDDGIAWWAVAMLVLVAVPATVLLNAAEYRVSAHLLGLDPPWGPAMEVSVLASAANVLPIPGAALVRSQALHRLGSTYRAALSSTAVIGVAWVGVSVAVAGALLLAEADDVVLGAGFLAAGAALIVAAVVLLRRRGGAARTPAVIARVLLVESGSIGLNTLRIWLALHVIGFSVSPAQAAALAVSAVIASAVGFLPAGLGLREIVAGGIGPLVGLTTAESVVAAAIDRVANLAVLAVLSLVLVARARRRGDVPEEP